MCLKPQFTLVQLTPAWNQSELGKRKSELIADFAYLYQPYQDVGTFGDSKPKAFSETETVITEMFLKSHRFFS